jgi:hypothetical protein
MKLRAWKLRTPVQGTVAFVAAKASSIEQNARRTPKAQPRIMNMYPACAGRPAS